MLGLSVVMMLGAERTLMSLSPSSAVTRATPAGMEVPSSFEQVGHVAHVNLREEQLP